MRHDLAGLRNGVVLAELGGYGDGPYCARHGAGSALVMLGTYIVDAGAEVPYDPRFVFKPGRGSYADYLKEHVSAARGSGAQIGVSVVSIELADTVDFLQAAEAAGADYASLCAHSTMAMFVGANVSSALCRRANWGELRRWAEAIVRAVRIPVIFKIGYHDTADTLGAVGVMAAAGVPIVHINVGGTDPGAEGLAVIQKLKGRYGNFSVVNGKGDPLPHGRGSFPSKTEGLRRCPFLIAGGGVKNVEGARRVLAAGADAVALGTAAMTDATLCGRIQSALRSQ